MILTGLKVSPPQAEILTDLGCFYTIPIVKTCSEIIFRCSNLLLSPVNVYTHNLATNILHVHNVQFVLSPESVAAQY